MSESEKRVREDEMVYELRIFKDRIATQKANLEEATDDVEHANDLLEMTLDDDEAEHEQA